MIKIKFYRLIEKIALMDGMGKGKLGYVPRWNKLYRWANDQKHDEIDCRFGPSMLAEYHAKKSGYWNAFIPVSFLGLNKLIKGSLEEMIMASYLIVYYQIREYK